MLIAVPARGNFSNPIHVVVAVCPSRQHQRRRVQAIVLAADAMIDPISPDRRRTPLQRSELRNQPGVVEQPYLARHELRQDVEIDLAPVNLAVRISHVNLGWAASARGTNVVATGSAASLAGKSYTTTSKPTGPGQFTFEAKTE
jgi:hypothetical protein